MRSIGTAAAICTLALLARASSAELPAENAQHRWVPSLAITSGLIADGARGGVTSSIRPSAAGTESFASPWLGGSVGIATPALEVGGVRSRLFAHAGVAGNFGVERDLAKEGSPGPFVVPPENADFGEITVEGQGSTASAGPRGLQSSAGVGVSIEVDTPWRTIRVKPSFEYLHEQVRISGGVRRAQDDDLSIQSYLFFVISGSRNKDFHGIGPGLELETDVSRVGPFEIALALSGSAYKILGNRSVTFTETDPTAAQSATWRYRKQAWTYRGYVGLRFLWSPDGKRSR